MMKVLLLDLQAQDATISSEIRKRLIRYAIDNRYVAITKPIERLDEMVTMIGALGNGFNLVRQVIRLLKKRLRSHSK